MSLQLILFLLYVGFIALINGNKFLPNLLTISQDPSL